MGFPGPNGWTLALELLLWGASAVVVGEAIRRLIPGTVGFLARVRGIERGLFDLYLGGALMYLLAACSIGIFGLPLILAVTAVSAVSLAVAAARSGSYLRLRELATTDRLFRFGPVVALLSAAAVFALETAVAVPVGTGNTYDSGLLTLYTAVLVHTGSLPLSFQPYASVGLLYPQGTTVWLGWAQLTLGLPGARTSLLVTPLFLALAPLAGFGLGRHWFGSEHAGAALAVAMAFLGSWTRVLVSGSNDFVFAFPLVLLLLGVASEWWATGPPSVPDALGFGLLAGYSAALNPIGAEWLFVTFLGAAVVIRSATVPWARRVGRWGLSAAASLVAVVPTFFVLASNGGDPRLWGSYGGAGPAGISSGQFLGGLDPFLFGTGDAWLSPLPLLRLELALLLALGAVALVLAPRGSEFARRAERFRAIVLAGSIVLILDLAVLWAASTGFTPLVELSVALSLPEVSIWLFTLFTFVATIPLVLAFEWLFSRGTNVARPARPRSVPTRWMPSRPVPVPTVLVALLALLIIVPGVELTPAQLPAYLSGIYDQYGNVTSEDFQLLEYAGAHLPAGARVLVAPGSAAEFLPAYARDVRLLYPMIPGWLRANASYTLLVDELRNATLDRSGVAAIAQLGVQYVIVTGASTTLWLPLSARPLLDPTNGFVLLYHSGDAYLFHRATTPSGVGG